MERKQSSTGSRCLPPGEVTAVLAAVALSCSLLAPPPAMAHKPWTDSPLSDSQQITLEGAGRYLKSRKYKQAAQIVESVLASANDVSKCLAIAEYTESYGFPMMESRRACLNRAYSLAVSREDLILVALKSRKYQFFEITRQAVASLIANAKTTPDLYDLAKKSQEVALNDVAHLAMEKVYTGVKDQNAAFAFAEQCKAMGMDDLLRKVIKELLDDEDDVTALCDLLLKLDGYQMRDEMRYGLRKALDKASTIAEMQSIFETSRRLNEPDIANRASYFVRKGKIIQKIKEDRSAYEAQLRGWREGADVDAARNQDASASSSSDAGFGGSSSSGMRKGSTPAQPPSSGF